MSWVCAMSMWFLLLMMNIVVPITGAVTAAHDLEAGWIGYCVAMVIGLVLAAFSVWTLWAMGRWAVRVTPADDARTTWPIRMLYWAAITWLLMTLVGSDWLSRAILEML